MNFLEDSFDLKDFKKETIKKRNHLFRQKYDKLAKAIIFVFVVLALIAGLLLYDFINYSVELWRTKQYEQNITKYNKI